MPQKFFACRAPARIALIGLVALVVVLWSPVDSGYARTKISVPAPLGLTWGWTIADLQRNGVKIRSNKRNKTGDGNILTISNTPEQISGTNLVTISVPDGYGLQKVSWSSIIFRNDRSGSKGKARYGELKSALTRKYGPPKSYEWLSKTKKYAQQIGEFYKCMRVSGCGSWTSYWTTNYVGSISLKMKGLTTGNGYVSLSYEGPEFSRYIGNRKKRSEKNAL